LSADPARTGISVDFDGTLAEIVPVPEEARPLSGATEVLRLLAARFAVMAVVSGRPVSFLADRLSVSTPDNRIQLFGEYGLECRLADGSVSRDPAVEHYLADVAAALREARASAKEGVHVEEKGISLTLNWRRATRYADDTLELADRLAARHALALRRGKMAVELIPRVGRDKGTVVAELFAGLAAGCVLGDDLADLPAFAAAEAIARERPFEAVRVVAMSGEVPPELVAAADLSVEGPAGALSFLRALAAGVRPSAG
jgi:trehalose 6-phosphate phosphatase